MKKKITTILAIISFAIIFCAPLKTLATSVSWLFTVGNPQTLTPTGTITGGGCLESTKVFHYTGVATTVFKSDGFFSEVWRGQDNTKCFASRGTSILENEIRRVYELGKPGGNWNALGAAQGVTPNNFAVHDSEYKYYELKLTMPEEGFIAQIRLPKYDTGTNDYGPALAEGKSDDNTELNLTANNGGWDLNNPAPVSDKYTGKLAVFVFSTSPKQNSDGTTSPLWYYEELDQSQFVAGEDVRQIGASFVLYKTAALTKTFTEADFKKTAIPAGLVDLSLVEQLTGTSCPDGQKTSGYLMSAFCSLALIIHAFAQNFTEQAVSLFTKVVGFGKQY